ncbi:MAG: GntR family transcriptional regulator [Comamonadaceae bacterium]|nr:GntR family transcriptional regulator [Comamonadaceae bacterium]
MSRPGSAKRDSSKPADSKGQHETIALYVRIASILKGRIVRGDWPHGALVPGVDQLSTTYNVARATARQALQALVAEGLIVSERGRGSRVSYVKPPLSEIDGGLFQVLAPEPKEHKIVVLERRHRVSLNTALFKVGSPYESYTLIRKVHLLSGIPYGYYEVSIASEIYERLPAGADTRQKLARLMAASGVEMAKGEDILTVDSADWEEAKYLEYPMASPIARIVRVMTDRSGRIAYAANNIYRGDKFKQTRAVSGYLYVPDEATSSKAKKNVNSLG